MRIKSNWFKPGKQHTPEELAGALSFVAWRIADNALKNTRKANFEVETGPQYFAFFNEFLIFLVMVADRIAYRRLPGEDRAMFTGTLANRVAETQAENQSRLLGGGSPAFYKQAFIDQVNLRADGYADFDYGDEGPSFNFTRYLAYCMGEVMSEKDSGWIIDQMMSIEAPAAVDRVEKTFRELLETEPRPARQRKSAAGD
ncbi:MAG: hypothetical protein U1C96_09460 [Gallionella sp.]|nr:hypothetical protein [Gallionella sp.]